MIKFIKNWKKQRKATAKLNGYINGYNWATGALLRSEETPMSIDAYVSGNDRTAFDVGADEACRKLIELKIIEDNTI